MTGVRPFGRALLGLLVTSSLAVPAAGQVITPPERSTPRETGEAASRTRHDLRAVGTVLAGYDRDSTFDASQPGQVGPLQGNNLFADGNLRYAVVKGLHSLTTTGHGYVTAYPDAATDPGFGGDGSAQVSTGIGRTQFTGGATVRSDPFFTLGAFVPLQGSVDTGALPDASPINAIDAQRAITLQASGSVARQWSLRHTTEGRINYMRRNRTGVSGRDFTTRDLQASHNYLIGRTTTIGGSYVRTENEFFTPSGSVAAGNMTMDIIEGTVGRTVRVSRSRRILVNGGAGAQYVTGQLGVAATPYEYWAPTVRLTVLADIGRSWTMGGDYRRTVAALDGVSGDSFPSDTFFVRTGGPIAGRLSVAFSGGFADGQAGASDVSASYRNYTMTGQISYAIAQCCSAVVNYNRFDYVVNGTVIGGLLPRDISRSSIRAGLSIATPVARPRRAPAGRRSSGN